MSIIDSPHRNTIGLRRLQAGYELEKFLDGLTIARQEEERNIK